MENDEKPSKAEEIKRQFAEWREDYAAAKKRDTGESPKDDVSGAEDSLKPTLPKGRNKKDRDGGMER